MSDYVDSSNIGPEILGFLPARSGSKGLPGKNALEISGKPLLAWAAEALLSCSLVSRAICSTDSPDLAQVARNAGLETPFLRPSELADDISPVRDSLLHALDFFLDSEGTAFDYVVLVQATSPTVLVKDVTAAIQLAIRENLDTVFSAVQVRPENHPSAMFQGKGSSVDEWIMSPSSVSLRRQDQPVFYSKTGLVYVFKASSLRTIDHFYAGRTGFVEIETERAISIDDYVDFEKAKRLLVSDV